MVQHNPPAIQLHPLVCPSSFHCASVNPAFERLTHTWFVSTSRSNCPPSCTHICPTRFAS
ncbi:hypothetical protein BJX70DRAFT_359064 [Aspergillus crustosus]